MRAYQAHHEPADQVYGEHCEQDRQPKHDGDYQYQHEPVRPHRIGCEVHDDLGSNRPDEAHHEEYTAQNEGAFAQGRLIRTGAYPQRANGHFREPKE